MNGYGRRAAAAKRLEEAEEALRGQALWRIGGQRPNTLLEADEGCSSAYRRQQSEANEGMYATAIHTCLYVYCMAEAIHHDEHNYSAVIVAAVKADRMAPSSALPG